MNEPGPNDGFVCKNHMVSFAIPLIFKSCLDLKLKIKPARTKPQGDELETSPCFPVLEENHRLHLPEAFCFLFSWYGEIAVRFGFARRIFPSCAATSTEISRGAQVNGSWRSLSEGWWPGLPRRGFDWLRFRPTSALTEPVSFNH